MLFADVPWYSTLLNWLVVIASLLLIFIVLIQRGKGGGLAGAFGGVGGSMLSAHVQAISSHV